MKSSASRLKLLVAVLLAAPAAHAQCVNGFKLAVDVGHTLSQPGATSASGVTEFHYNQRLAAAVVAATTQAGIPTITIGAAGTPLQLTERTRQAQAAGASLFLSLHHDSVQQRYLSTWTVDGQQRPYSDRFAGYSVFVSAANPRYVDSLGFATALGSALRAGGMTPSLHHAEPIPGESRPLLDPHLGIYRFDGLAVLRTATMPAALLEAGIILNRQEEKTIASPAFAQRVATAVVTAVRSVCATPNRAPASAPAAPPAGPLHQLFRPRPNPAVP